MQTTYRRLTAATILKTARVEVMRAGNAEIVINLPCHSETAIAHIGVRADGWGGEIEDVLVIRDADGLVCKLSTTPRSFAKLEALEAERERVQMAENAVTA